MNKFAIIPTILCLLASSSVIALDKPIALDSRIKTIVYSENEVFRIVVNYGYQTSLEFADGEEIQTMSAGNNFAWQLTPIGRRLFIKPLEENILTNMTILTNKRTYHLEIQSKSSINTNDDEMQYVVRFFYPDSDIDMKKPDVLMDANQLLQSAPTIKPFNFNYTYTGVDRLAPTKIFDDGINTFFKLPKNLKHLPDFYALDDKKTPLITRKKGEYYIVNNISKGFVLVYGDKEIYVHNGMYSVE